MTKKSKMEDIEPMKKSDMGIALFSLSEQGVESIGIYYSGSGDSGEISEIELNYKSRKQGSREVPERWDEIRDMLEEWAYERLQNEDDWYNNDGGEGNFQIDVPSGEYTLHHGVRVVNYSDSQGDLKEEDYFKD